jgi:hypothetical protein
MVEVHEKLKEADFAARLAEAEAQLRSCVPFSLSLSVSTVLMTCVQV